MRKSISWILKFIDELPSDKERIEALKQNEQNNTLTLILRMFYDPNIVFLLPEGEPPYTPCQYPHQENMLYLESRKLYLFVKGGNDNLNQIRRETIFVEMLQSVDNEDAKLLIAMKDKTMPFKNITKDLIKKAYPGLY